MSRKINGLADGVNHILETCLFRKWSKCENEEVENFNTRYRQCRGLRHVETKLNATASARYLACLLVINYAYSVKKNIKLEEANLYISFTHF